MTSEDDLRTYFAGRLPARLAELEEAREAAREAGWQAESLRGFHRLAHSLAGAGSTFGFPEVTEAAGRLEGLLGVHLGGGTLPEDEVEAILARLREVAAGPSHS